MLSLPFGVGAGTTSWRHDLASSRNPRSIGEMNDLPPPPPPPPPGRGQRRPDTDRSTRNTTDKKSKSPDLNADGTPASGRGPGSWPKWTIWVLIGVLAAAFLVPSLWPSNGGETLEYSEWRTQVIEPHLGPSVVIGQRDLGGLGAARS